MIFIKNHSDGLTCADIKNEKEAESSQIALVLSEFKKSNDVELELDIRGEDPLKLVKSTVKDLSTSISRSIERIGKITGDLEVTEGEEIKSSVVSILDNKPTDITFFINGEKTVLKDTEALPNTIDIYTGSDVEKQYYSRDMIVLVFPNKINGANCKFNLVIDRRNIGAPTKTVIMENHTIVVLYIKWPMWSKLKIPVYGYVRIDFEDGSESQYISPFKLGSVKHKDVYKNTIVDVDIDEAFNYLQESFRIIKERKAKMEKNNERPAYTPKERTQDTTSSNHSHKNSFNKSFGKTDNFNKSHNKSYSNSRGNNNRNGGLSNNKRNRNNRVYK